MIRFDILTKKRYESDLIRPELETQSKRYPIDPSNQILNFELILSDLIQFSLV